MIDSYSFGNITIEGQKYLADVIIYPDHVDDTWWRTQGHVCSLADLPDVWPHRPVTLVIGTGHPGLMRVDDDLKHHCADNGIELVVLPTAQAVAAFNGTRDQGKVVIAAVHLTC